MALVNVCDICGAICKSNSRYELVYKGIIQGYKNDICYDCIGRIKEEIKENKEK